MDADLDGRRVLVTGASGFIGGHLCRRLRSRGAAVHAVSRAGRSAEEIGLRWWQADLAETAAVRAVVRSVEPDVIFHLASQVAGARDLQLVLPMFRANLMSTVNLLAVASEIGCRRIVLAGSMEEPESGNPEAVACSPYAVAKWAGSAYARMFHGLYQLPVVILRIFMVYGPEQPDVQKLIPYVILSLLRGERPRLASGRREIDWVYVDDVVDALLAAARVDGAEGRTIDVGSGELVSIRAVVERLVQLIDPRVEPVFGALEDRPLEQVRAADTARSGALLGWKPATSLGEGLKWTVESYAQRPKAGAL